MASNLRRFRTEAGWRQADLAGHMAATGLGWTPNRVAQVETLRRPLTLLELATLCALFRRPLTELLAGEEEVDLPALDTMGESTTSLAWIRGALAQGASGQIRPPGAAAVAHVATDETRKAAAKLGISTDRVEATAERLWGRSLRAERDYRAGDLSGMPSRSAQAKRGHVMRELLEELRGGLGQG